jgi:hypothetical protein
MENTMKGSYFLAVLLSALLLCDSVSADNVNTVEQYWGVAKDPEGKVVYREKHTTRYINGRILTSVTNYIDPDGWEVAMMESNYERSVPMPTYVFKDYRRDYEEGVRFRDGKYYIFNRDPERGEKEKPLGDTKNVYSCQGWHYYVVNHLEELEKDQAFTLKLIFPNKLRSYPFRIEKVGSSEETMDVRVRFANRIISWLVPHLDLVYNKKKKKLIEFQGVSNIFDADDELQNVRITYYEKLE